MHMHCDLSAPPPLPMATDPRGVTILFVEISDSIKLYESLGNVIAFGEIYECLQMFEEETVAHGGRVVKTIGAGSMCAFPDANAAVQAACAIQQRAQEHQPLLGQQQVELRIGLHHGAAMIQADEVYRDTVNTASRMVQFATAGQIITTGETVALLAPELRSATRRLDALPVKGKHEEVVVYQVLRQASSDYTQMPGRGDTIIEPAAAARLRLKHAGREITVVTSITLGRNGSCGIVLKDPMASRHHALIERQKDKFVLTDHSSNNTFVTLKEGEEFRLRREKMVLPSFGIISFGRRPFDMDAEIITFLCEPKTDPDAGQCTEVGERSAEVGERSDDAESTDGGKN